MSKMDFTVPFLHDVTRVYYKQPSQSDLRWRVVIDVLTWPVILLTLAAVVTTAIVLFFFDVALLFISQDSRSRPEELVSFSIKSLCQSIFLLFGHLLKQGNTLCDEVKVPSSVRVVYATWCLFSLILSVTFTAYLVPALGVVKNPPLFNTLTDLINSGDYKWGRDGGETFLNEYFQVTKDQRHLVLGSQIQQFVIKDPQVISGKSRVHRRKVLEEKYAYITSTSPVIDFYNSTCDLTYIQEGIVSTSFAFPLAENSPYTEAFSGRIMDLFGNGQMNILLHKWQLHETDVFLNPARYYTLTECIFPPGGRYMCICDSGII